MRGPSLGRLLEFSVSAEPLAAAIQRYAALGLREVPVTDFVPGARAVVSDGRVSIGLHAGELDGPVATFVRPDLKTHVRALEAVGVELEIAELADDQFHRVGFRDPNGVPIMLVEARTFPPVEVEPGNVSVCGTFAELSIATDSLAESSRFWASLGFTVCEEQHRGDRGDAGAGAGSARGTGDTTGAAARGWHRLEGYGLVIGLHETTRFRSALTFDAPQLDGRVEYARAKGFELRRETPLHVGARASATLHAPGGLKLFLLDSTDAE